MYPYNKGKILYNLQSDYMDRIKPDLNPMKPFENNLHNQQLNDSIHKGFLNGVVTTQNQVDQDLAHQITHTVPYQVAPEKDRLRYRVNPFTMDQRPVPIPPMDMPIAGHLSK